MRPAIQGPGFPIAPKPGPLAVPTHAPNRTTKPARKNLSPHRLGTTLPSERHAKIRTNFALTPVELPPRGELEVAQPEFGPTRMAETVQTPFGFWLSGGRKKAHARSSAQGWIQIAHSTTDCRSPAATERCQKVSKKIPKRVALVINRQPRFRYHYSTVFTAG